MCIGLCAFIVYCTFIPKHTVSNMMCPEKWTSKPWWGSVLVPTFWIVRNRTEDLLSIWTDRTINSENVYFLFCSYCNCWVYVCTVAQSILSAYFVYMHLFPECLLLATASTVSSASIMSILWTRHPLLTVSNVWASCTDSHVYCIKSPRLTVYVHCTLFSHNLAYITISSNKKIKLNHLCEKLISCGMNVGCSLVERYLRIDVRESYSCAFSHINPSSIIT